MAKKAKSPAQQKGADVIILEDGVSHVPGVRKEQYRTRVEVDGRKSDVICEYQFNQRTGLPAWQVKIHSKHISLESAEQASFLQSMQTFLRRIYDIAIQDITDHQEGLALASGQKSLFSATGEPAVDDEADPAPKGDMAVKVG